MKKNLTSLALTALLCTSLLTAASCVGNAEDTAANTTASVEYSVDNTPTELTAAVNAALPASADMSAPDPGIILAYYDSVSEELESFAVLINASGMTQDEYGIFKVKTDESIPAVEAAVREYLDAKLAAFTGDYTPEEKPKLENASIKTFGKYVVYCTLSEEDTATVFTTVENTLLGK